MKTSTVTIEGARCGNSSKGRVAIDGQVVPGLVSVKTSLTVDELPVVTLELCIPQEIKIENASIVVAA